MTVFIKSAEEPVSGGQVTERYPNIIFKSTNVEHNGNEYRITGDLTMHGLTRAGVTVKGKLNRTGWGLKWNQVLEVCSLLVEEEIKFDFDVQATAQQPRAA